MRLLHPFADAPPDRFLVQLQKTAKQCRPDQPLVIFKGKGVYTPEMKKILAGERPLRRPPVSRAKKNKTMEVEE
ncbi:MAG: hypothetical protein L6428_03310 [Candidatus Aminicenantes bacterium]|nr:hypothetical protein [Acidobacteriota bacterium]MCG2810473.1 hypothetical protein [Candidatus Aminicenantes bacterium]